MTTSLYERTREAAERRDTLVREGVEWLEGRGLSRLSSAILVCWAIERANKQRRECAPWPA